MVKQKVETQEHTQNINSISWQWKEKWTDVFKKKILHNEGKWWTRTVTTYDLHYNWKIKKMYKSTKTLAKHTKQINQNELKKIMQD